MKLILASMMAFLSLNVFAANDTDFECRKSLGANEELEVLVQRGFRNWPTQKVTVTYTKDGREEKRVKYDVRGFYDGMSREVRFDGTNFSLRINLFPDSRPQRATHYFGFFQSRDFLNGKYIRNMSCLYTVF